MIVGARLVAKTPRSVSHTLHTGLRRLDGHPLIDAVHVGCEGTGDDEHYCVRVTLVPTADAAKYGFRDADAVTWSTTTVVTSGAVEELDEILVAQVTRGGRTWPLHGAARRTHARSTTPWADRSRITDWMPLAGDVCVPNAPSLTVDVFSCVGGEREWTLWGV